MTAQEQMKKMLDELMGTKRDGESTEAGVKFTDAGVCKSFLMGLCPHEQFHNTKLDLGPCHKYHSLALKADFEIASKQKDYGYDVDQLEHLKSFVRDCDRIVEVNKKRLEDNNDENDTSAEAMEVHTLNEKIGKFLAESEALGADGKVEESLSLMKQVEELKVQKRQAEEVYRNTLPVTTTQQQKLRVCEICGAYLSLYDNDRRLADHFGGKLHMGFIKIRERLAELQESVAIKREEKEKEREARRKEREEERKRDKYQSRDRRQRSRSREDSKRRDRSRDRDRHRDHSRDRDRRRRDDYRSRDRRRDDSRDRYRSRDRKSREDRNSTDKYRSSDAGSERSREGSRQRSKENDDRDLRNMSKEGKEGKEDGEIDSANDTSCYNEDKVVNDYNQTVKEEKTTNVLAE